MPLNIESPTAYVIDDIGRKFNVFPILIDNIIKWGHLECNYENKIITLKYISNNLELNNYSEIHEKDPNFIKMAQNNYNITCNRKAL
jgi:hypothetical protein